MRKPLILLILGIALFCGYEKAYADHHIRTQDINDICHTKTGTIRNVPESVKKAVYIRDGVPGGNYKEASGLYAFEVDHIVSLELGGSNDPSNLKIQSGNGACNYHHKDHLENKLHALVCSNVVTIKEAQTVIYNDWKSAYSKYIDPSGCE